MESLEKSMREYTKINVLGGIPPKQYIVGPNLH